MGKKLFNIIYCTDIHYNSNKGITVEETKTSGGKGQSVLKSQGWYERFDTLINI